MEECRRNPVAVQEENKATEMQMNSTAQSQSKKNRKRVNKSTDNKQEEVKPIDGERDQWTMQNEKENKPKAAKRSRRSRNNGNSEILTKKVSDLH